MVHQAKFEVSLLDACRWRTNHTVSYPSGLRFALDEEPCHLCWMSISTTETCAMHDRCSRVFHVNCFHRWLNTPEWPDPRCPHCHNEITDTDKVPVQSGATNQNGITNLNGVSRPGAVARPNEVPGLSRAPRLTFSRFSPTGNAIGSFILTPINGTMISLPVPPSASQLPLPTFNRPQSPEFKPPQGPKFNPPRGPKFNPPRGPKFNPPRCPRAMTQIPTRNPLSSQKILYTRRRALPPPPVRIPQRHATLPNIYELPLPTQKLNHPPFPLRLTADDSQPPLSAATALTLDLLIRPSPYASSSSIHTLHLPHPTYTRHVLRFPPLLRPQHPDGDGDGDDAALRMPDTPILARYYSFLSPKQWQWLFRQRHQHQRQLQLPPPPPPPISKFNSTSTSTSACPQSQCMSGPSDVHMDGSGASSGASSGDPDADSGYRIITFTGGPRMSSVRFLVYVSPGKRRTEEAEAWRMWESNGKKKGQGRGRGWCLDEYERAWVLRARVPAKVAKGKGSFEVDN